MEIFDHSSDAIKRPKYIRCSNNLWAMRFESMKIMSCSAAVETLLHKQVISPETTLVDSSSGIYAYALALTCHKHNLRCHIIASTTVDQTLLFQLRALGATVEQVPASSSLKYDQQLRVKLVQSYLAENPRAYWMRQYHDSIHYQGYRALGRELQEFLAQHESNSEINLVTPVGSGASAAGLYSGLAVGDKPIQVTGIQPFGSVSFGSQDIEDPDVMIAGIGSAIHFDNINYGIFDNIHWVSSSIVQNATIRLLRDTGIFAGLSSGASYCVARYLADVNPRSLTVFICPDMGHRYVSALQSFDYYDSHQVQPRWIRNLQELEPPWSAMKWGRRSGDPVDIQGGLE